MRDPTHDGPPGLAPVIRSDPSLSRCRVVVQNLKERCSGDATDIAEDRVVVDAHGIQVSDDRPRLTSREDHLSKCLPVLVPGSIRIQRGFRCSLQGELALLDTNPAIAVWRDFDDLDSLMA